MTGDELSATTRIEAAEAELEVLVTTRRREIEALRDDLRAAQQVADGGARRLLSTQGDEDLTEAVCDTLSQFGFIVERRDESVPAGQAKQEDLRVTPPDGRTGIAEVKGYVGGAKARDLLKIRNYATLFERETGGPPERQWYVCNQFLATDPDLRQEILAGADDVLEEFATTGGVVIDTRELFKLLRLVEDGDLSVEDARAALWTAPPRFTAPSPPTEPASRPDPV